MIFICFLISLNLSGTTLKNNLVIDTVKIVQTKSETTNSSEYYKMLYENTQDANSKLLSLLTTAMTVVIAVIIAIIGSSFFYNYKFNKKEYELLTKETTNLLEEAQKNLLKETRLEIIKMAELNKKEIETNFTQLSETYKTNYETFRDSIKSIIEAYNNSNKEILIKQEEEIENINKKIAKLEEKSKQDIDFNSKKLKIDILGIQADLYFMKNWFSLALSNYVNQCLLCIENNQHWQLKFVADDIVKSIEKTIQSQKTITGSVKRNIEKLISVLPDSVLDKKKKIEDEYLKIQVKEIKFEEA